MNGLTRYMMLSGGNRAPDTNGNRMEYRGGMQDQMRSGYDNNYSLSPSPAEVPLKQVRENDAANLRFFFCYFQTFF